MHSDFVHLHLHTEYSLLQSTIKIEDLMKEAAKQKAPAIAMTDNGNMFGAIQFYSKAMKHGIKPIIGFQAYVSPSSRFDRQTHGIKEASFRLTLLAKNETGYKNLMKLSSSGYLEGFYYKPRVDKELLAEHSEGIIALSGDYKGEIHYYLLNDQPEDAKRALSEYLEIFGKDNFYLEIMDHGLESDKKLIAETAKLAKEFNIPLVACNNVHYIEQDGAQAHDAMICIGSGNLIEDQNRFRFQSDQYYLKTAEEMKKLFKDYPEAISNTIKIAERCNLKIDFDTMHLPFFPPPEGKSQEGYLQELCEQGLERVFGKKLPEGYQERLNMELDLIKKMGYVSYFLIVWDFIHYSNQKGIPVGPGRGSAAGSLVSYALGITNIDPIKYDLYFERFLNPERVSMPDIDIDFCYERRDEVIDYVRKKYGHGSVAQIITFGTMAAKAAIRDVGRVMNIPYGDVDKIAKLIPLELKITIASALEKEPELKKLQETDARVKALLDTSIKLEGLSRHASIHAAGVVIADGELTQHCGLFRASDEQSCTQYNMKDLENIGLLKMDFLGLRTLTVVHDTAKLIKQHRNEDIDVNKLPEGDEKTYQMLSDGNALGVFQLESSGMRDLLKKMKPHLFEHLVALLALYRPGPLGSGMVDDFVKRMHDPKLIKYDHPLLESSLKETYGIILYQEQVMRLVSDLAGFTLAQADLLRRAIGKKIPEVMEEQRKNFIAGATANDVPQKTCEKVWDLVEYFSGYGFNKSHSTAYAFISYQTAYLKAHYTVEFMTALLTSEMGNTTKVVRYIEESKKMGIEVLPPSINDSFSDFTCGENHIRFGLAAIKNVGHTAIESLVKEREEGGEYKSLYDFAQRVDLRVCNRKVIESLIKCGACDIWGLHRSQLMAVLDAALDMGSNLQKDMSRGQLSFFGEEDAGFGSNEQVPDIEEWPENQKLAYEKELIGFYVSSHPLRKYDKMLKVYATASSDTLSDLLNQSEVTLGGILDSSREILTKKGKKMAFVQMQDLLGSYEVVVFPKAYEEYGSMLLNDRILFVRGKVDSRDDTPKLLADEFVPIEEVKKRFTRIVSIHLQTTGLTQELLNELKEALKKHKGKTPVHISFQSPSGKRAILDSGLDLHVDVSDQLFEDLEGILGENAVKISV